jgi:hypothetical protein
MFAGDHQQYMPGAHHGDGQWWVITPSVRLGEGPVGDWPGGGYPLDGVAEDQVDSPGTTGRPEAPMWRYFGTSLQTYADYGLTTKVLDCPSNIMKPEQNVWGDWGGLGERVDVEYLMVGGCQGNSAWGYDGPGSIALSAEGYAWNNDPDVPRAAVRSGDADEVLACDLVMFRNDALQTNHRGTKPEVPDFQNVLWGDGHVASHNAGYYSDEPEDVPDYDNYSIRSWFSGFPNSFYYFY